MRTKPATITELPPSPEVERHSRMIKYAVAQGIRVLCIIAVFFVPGWWVLIPAAGAVFLPYFAVVAANNVRQRPATVLRPGAIVAIDTAASPASGSAAASSTTASGER